MLESHTVGKCGGQQGESPRAEVIRIPAAAAVAMLSTLLMRYLRPQYPSFADVHEFAIGVARRHDEIALRWRARRGDWAPLLDPTDFKSTETISLPEHAESTR